MEYIEDKKVLESIKLDDFSIKDLQLCIQNLL